MKNSNYKAAVSVIIPCYNSERTVCRAINSIESQRLLPTEVIIVDDASVDSSVSILRKLIESCPLNIQLIELADNKGAANARNVGWDASTQQYIAFLDADDAWHPRKLEIQYQFMQNNPNVDMSGHESIVITDLASLDWPLREGMHVAEVEVNRLLFSNPFVTPSVMLKRQIKLRFNAEKRYMEDYLLWLDISLKKLKISKLHIPLVALYKPMFGASGLSSHMMEMAKSDLSNYWLLFSEKKISIFTATFFSMLSLIKFIRRLLMVSIRRLVNA